MESIRSLAHYYSVNPNTVQRVISDLERKGLVVIKRGIGTIVSDETTIINLKEEVLVNKSIEFTKELTNMGFDLKQIVEAIQGCIDNENK